MDEIVEIEEWKVVNFRFGDFRKNPLQKFYLHGVVYGHKRFYNGEKITTSLVVGKKGDLVITESGTLYSLGLPEDLNNKKEDFLNLLTEISEEREDV